MARPVRLYPHPFGGDFNLLNVNFIYGISVSGTVVSFTVARGQAGESFQVSYPSEAEALAAAEVWRARVDDAP